VSLPFGPKTTEKRKEVNERPIFDDMFSETISCKDVNNDGGVYLMQMPSDFNLFRNDGELKTTTSYGAVDEKAAGIYLSLYICMHILLPKLLYFAFDFM
jgi:hypothetical protein